MTMVRSFHFGTSTRRIGTMATAVAVAVLMAACGGGDKKGGTQVAAKVNKDEISVHQVNQVLERQPGLKPEQLPTAGKAVLDSLIDQQLALQQAQEQKLDRDPKVVMAIESARRELIARAYIDKVAESAAKPTDDEIAAYYRDKPALFAQRRIYVLQEFSIEAQGDAVKKVLALAQAAKTGDDLAKQLGAAGVKFAARNVTQPAENLPLTMVDRLGQMAEGQSLAQPGASGGVSVVFLLNAKVQPVNAEQAKPVIAQFLTNERRRKVVTDEMKRLRDSAKIDYVGEFAGAASAAPAKP